MATLGLSEADRTALDAFKRDVVDPSMASLVLAYFTAAWCGPCKQLGPILDKVAADYAAKGVLLHRIDIDKNKAIAAQFRVQSIPTVYAVFQGQLVADLTPARTESQLKTMLDQILAKLPIQSPAADLEAELAPLIAMGEEIYVIDPRKCTECVGHFDEPQCQQVCPVDCIPLDPAWRESREQLMDKYHQLQQAIETAAGQKNSTAPSSRS